MPYRVQLLAILVLIISTHALAGGKGSYPYPTPYAVEDLKNGIIADTVQPSNVDHFFNRYFLHRITKLHGECNILFETTNFVYYGYPWTNEYGNRMIYRHYKISKDSLSERLPSYKELSMSAIESLVLPCWDTVDNYYKNHKKAVSWVKPSECIHTHTYQLTDDYIVLHRLYKIKSLILDFVTVDKYSYTIFIDKKTLKIAHTEKIIDSKM
ncbi:MAG TPA: hypothetical protein VIN07_15155 [Flavipsychrobacter sp.]